VISCFGEIKQRNNYDAKYIDDSFRHSLEQVKFFVKMCLLPELLSHCFTNKMVTTDTPDYSDEQDEAVESCDEQDIEDGYLPQPDDQPSSSTTASTSATSAQDNRTMVL